MIRTHLQSTLRDLHGLLTSPRLVTTFAVVVLLFVVTGPFGTLARMNFAERLGYWLAVQAGSWMLAITLSALADGLLQPVLPLRMARFITGSLMAAPLIGLYITALDTVLLGWAFDLPTILKMTMEAVPLCLLFCVLSYLTMERQDAARLANEGSAGNLHAAPAPVMPSSSELPKASQPGAKNETPPALLSRLKPENRGTLVHLSVEDHYTVVTTARGRELILLRFADAVAETAPTEGLQVHRSHWVADSAVAGITRRQAKLAIRLRDGTEVPVSRPYIAAVRARYRDI